MLVPDLFEEGLGAQVGRAGLEQRGEQFELLGGEAEGAAVPAALLTDRSLPLADSAALRAAAAGRARRVKYARGIVSGYS